jgi:hypothetical protein
MVLVVIVGVGATFVPKLTDEVNGLVQATPDYVHDLTQGNRSASSGNATSSRRYASR